MKDLLIQIIVLTLLIAFISGIPFYLNYSFKKKYKEYKEKQGKAHKVQS